MRADTGALHGPSEVLLLGLITEAGENQVQAGRAVEIQEMTDVRGAAHGDDRNIF